MSTESDANGSRQEQEPSADAGRLPADLAHHLIQPGGGGVCLVIGAGTSMEAPTSLKSAASYAFTAHEELVREGVLDEHSCPRPDDLSQVADAVVAATGTQTPLVLRLPRNQFKTARPNRGHLIAIACLLEEAVKGVITLNYDTALIAAVTTLGGGEAIGILEGPEDVTSLRMNNVFFIHRSANHPGETWIMCTVDLEETWKNGWESLVAAQIGGSPTVLFAGLGTPVPVLLDTVKKVREAYDGQYDGVFLAGPGEASDSDFAVALQLSPGRYIPRKWCQLMEDCSRVIVSRMCEVLADAAGTIEKQRGYSAGRVAQVCARLADLDLVDFGQMRSAWLLSSGPYQADNAHERPLVADLLLGIGAISEATSKEARFAPSGCVTFSGGDGRSAVLAFASGSGHKNWLTVDAELKSRLSELPTGTPQPARAILAAVHGGRVIPTSPEDIVREVETDSIIYGPAIEMFDIEELRANPALATELVA
ncbi:MAG: SIR2 family protein [Candidatus Dormibacteria bacterium]